MHKFTPISPLWIALCAWSFLTLNASAQYPTMIPITSDLLTQRPTTHPQRIHPTPTQSPTPQPLSDDIPEQYAPLLLLRSLCIGLLFIGSLTTVVIVLRRKST